MSATKTFRAILIDPEARSISELQSDLSLASIHRLIDAETLDQFGLAAWASDGVTRIWAGSMTAACHAASRSRPAAESVRETHLMRSDFTYRPWTEERRVAAKRAAAIRLYGSEKKAATVRAKKLEALHQQRTELQRQLKRVKAAIHHYENRTLP